MRRGGLQRSRPNRALYEGVTGVRGLETGVCSKDVRLINTSTKCTLLCCFGNKAAIRISSRLGDHASGPEDRTMRILFAMLFLVAMAVTVPMASAYAEEAAVWGT